MQALPSPQTIAKIKHLLGFTELLSDFVAEIANGLSIHQCQRIMKLFPVEQIPDDLRASLEYSQLLLVYLLYTGLVVLPTNLSSLSLSKLLRNENVVASTSAFLIEKAERGNTLPTYSVKNQPLLKLQDEFQNAMILGRDLAKNKPDSIRLG